jgi:predicted Fe-Mo cluster-binding NifX family protein
MRLAIPYWHGRVSPVLDVAGVLLLVDVNRGEQTNRQNLALEKGRSPLERARCIQGLDVDVLICGAISWPLELALVSAGIEVITQICGEVDQVLGAFLKGQLEKGMYLMPGCYGRRRRSRRGRQGGMQPS